MNRPAPDMPYTPATLAKRWTCTEQKVRRLCRDGSLCCFMVGSSYRITPQAVEDFEGQSWKPKSEDIETNASSYGAEATPEGAAPSPTVEAQAVTAMHEAAKRHTQRSTPSNVRWMHSADHKTPQSVK